jgi:hypothetical protein
VRIKALALRTAAPHAAHAPKTLKLVINRPSVGFEDVEDAALAQQLVLTPEQVASGARVPLRFVRFQSVTSLHVRSRGEGFLERTPDLCVDLRGR